MASKRRSNNRNQRGSNSNTRQGSNRNGKTYGSKKSNEFRTDNRDTNLSPLNDISWYSHYPDILSAAANLPFANRPGSVVQLAGANYTIPGVIQLGWIPSVGYSDSNSSPASVTARELYARVRSSFSGELPENGPDILMYLLALDSVFTYIGHLKRVYRTLNSYSIYNYQIPDACLNAMGFQSAAIEELRSDLPRFNSIINQLIYMASKFKCPKVFDLFDRHYWMTDNVYTDDATIASQLFVFNVEYLYQWDGTGSTGTQLKAVLVPRVKQTYGSDLIDSLFKFGTRLLDALTGDDDALTISGHLVRAFDGVPQWSPTQLGFDEVLNPVYVPEVLPQIENAFASRLSTNAKADLVISQDPNTNTIIHKPVRTGTTGSVPGHINNAVLNLKSLDPSAQEVTIATRLASYVDFEGSVIAPVVDGDTTSYAILCGTELVTAITLYSGTDISGTFNSYFETSYDVSSTSISGSKMFDLATQFDAVVEMGSFNYHPISVSKIIRTAGSSTTTFVNVFADVKNLAFPSFHDLYEIHKVCCYSELNSFV